MLTREEGCTESCKMPNQVEISRSVNRGVGASNVTAGRVSRSRMSMNSEIPSLYWEGRNVTPQSLAKLVRIEERQKEIEGGHKSQERKKSATPPSNEVELPMTQVHVQEQRVKPINNPRNSGNNKQGGTSIVNREETLSTELNVNGITEFILTETKTVTLLNVRSSVVAKDSRQYDTVVLQGREYDKRKVAQLESDRLTSRATQTPITVQKDKEVMVMAVSKKDVACESSTCDMLELTKWVQDVAGNHHVDHSKLVCNQPHGGSYSYLPMHNKLPQYGPSKQSDDLIAMALTDMTECFLNISGSYAPPPIPQRSGDARGTKRYTYYPNVGGANRREGTRSQSHWGGQSSTSVSHTRRRSVASDNNNTSFSVASHPRGDNASAAVSATLSAMRDPIRNGLSLKEVVKRLYVKQAKTIMESFELLSALKIVERCMANRVFHRKQLLYCYAPLFGSATSFHGDGITSDAKNEFSLITSTKVKVEGGKSKQSSSGLGSAELSSSYRCNRAGKRGRLSLEKLWIHPYPFCSQQVSTKAMSLTALSFNPECKNDGDGIAAGYSIRALHNGVGVSGAVKEGGKVLFWSLRNPNQPERTINTPSGVLTLSFNPEQPQLLAIGMYNGDVQIYDLSAHDDDASILVADSRTSSGKHMDPVWQVKWVKSESGEIYFVSVSTDGRVVKWSLKKGLSYNPMMLLKRVGDAKGILSRQTGGISIDFLPGNSSQYIVSTEDGPIHHCSTSYSEQFLKTYGGPSGDDYGNDGGHNGPVYRVQCSPLLENRFVSCGADWTVKVSVVVVVVSVYQENKYHTTVITYPTNFTY